MSALCDPPGAASPPRPPLSAQELAQEVKAFLSGVDPVQGTKLSLKDHARCALLLLRCLPPARHAALDHLRSLFDEQVCSHLLQRQNGGGGGPPNFNRPGSSSGGAGGGVLPNVSGAGNSGLEEVVQEVQGVLGEFVRVNPKSWAPLVSAWSIELMGQLSSKYSGRHGVPQASSLNELLQLWMSCEATRSLMEIYTQCLSAMIGGGPDACVDALLDTSLQHSPHFDWVVAHIGSSFPSTIINRVLSCGLKDFCAHGGGGGGGGMGGLAGDPLFIASHPPQAEKRPPKIASVVGILGHLASRHAGSIKQELLRMFHQSLAAGGAGGGGRGGEQHQKATVPFLLQLALMSPPLLATVTPELVDSLKPPLLNQLHQHFAPLPREELDNMLGVVVHLLSQTSAGAYRILQFLVNTATPASVITPPGPPAAPQLHEGVRESCDRIIQLLLLNLQKLVFNRGGGGALPNLNELPSSSSSSSSPPPAPPPRPVPFLDALKPHLRDLCLETLRLERKRFLWQHQLLALLGVYSPPHCAAEGLFLLLSLARTPEELALAPQLYSLLSSCLPDLLPATAAACVRQIHAGRLPQPQIAQLCRNLASLLQGEPPGGGSSSSPGGAPFQSGVGGVSQPPESMGVQLGPVLARHLHDWAQLLLHPHPEVAQGACLLLSVVPLPPSSAPPRRFLPPPAHLFAALRAAVQHFFLLLRRGEAAGIGHASRLLARLGAVSPPAAKTLLQQLVEGALRGGNAELFGAGGVKGSFLGEESRGEGKKDEVSLLETNRRFTSAVNFSGGVWSVFHAGVIGKGLKTPAGGGGGGEGKGFGGGVRDKEELDRNLHIFLSLLLRICCRGGAAGGGGGGGGAAGGGGGSRPPDAPPQVNPEAAKAVAAALVESVCPEAAGGGELLWPPPPEEQKGGGGGGGGGGSGGGVGGSGGVGFGGGGASVERDLRICRFFRQHPLLFPLLRLVAAGPPALCYCSPLLRGLLGSLMAYWESCRDPGTTGSPWHLQASCSLVAAMAEGSLLPPLLGDMHELFPHLAPFEVRLLLLSLWEYLRENAPLPQKFTFQPQKGLFQRDFARDGEGGRKHLGVLHSVLHRNIHRLGLLAARFRP